MDKLLEEFKKIGVLYIPIGVEDELVKFYEKCGFKSAKQVPMNISYSTYPI